MDWRRVEVLMLGWSDTIDQLAAADSWYGLVSTRALDFGVEGQWEKWRCIGTLDEQVEESNMSIV